MQIKEALDYQFGGEMGCRWLSDMTRVAYFNPIFIFSYPTRLRGITGDQCRATDHLSSLGAQGFLFKAVPNSMVKSHTQSFSQLLCVSNHSDLL